MTFLIRSLTSLAYVALLLGSLILNNHLFSVVIFSLMMASLWELQQISAQKLPWVFAGHQKRGAFWIANSFRQRLLSI